MELVELWAIFEFHLVKSLLCDQKMNPRYTGYHIVQCAILMLINLNFETKFHSSTDSRAIIMWRNLTLYGVELMTWPILRTVWWSGFVLCRILKQRSLMTGMSARRSMTLMTPSPRTGTSPSTFLTPMPRSLMTGMMRWTENGSPRW